MLKKISAILIPTLIAVALIWYMLYRVWDDMLVAVQYAVPIYLVFAIIICVIAWYLRGFRYKYIVKRLGTDLTLNFSTACIFLSQTANLIIPARLGDFVRMFVLKHEKNTSYTNGFTSIVAERAFDIIIIAVLGFCTLPFLITIVPDWFVYLIFLVLGLGVVFLVFLKITKRPWPRKRRRHVSRFGAFVLYLTSSRHFQSLNKILKKIREVLDQLRLVASNFAAISTLSVTSAAIWMLDVIICYLIALMFHVEIPFLLVLLAIVIGNLVKAVPITPGGIGTYELALVITFEIGGVSAATATLIAVIDHLVKNLVTLAGGVVSLYYFGDWAVSLLKRLFREDTKSLKDEHDSN